jgi:sugar phosphate isomerase/epimerase
MTEIAINTLAFHGYPLDTALEEIARLGRYVEPVYISKYDPTLREEYFNEANAQRLRQRLEGLRLKAPSMGSHMDLGRTDSVEVFRRRMEFARALGAGVILTNATEKSRKATFLRNIERLANYAEELDLLIALENPGDGQDQLLGTGLEGVAILEELQSNRVRLNYDFSNVFTYSKGTRHLEEELETVLPYVNHLHLKNVRLCEGAWPVCDLEAGIINYRRLLQQFPALSSIPMSVELPIRFGYDAEFRFGLRENLPIPSLDSIRKTLKDSMDYLAVALPQAT